MIVFLARLRAEVLRCFDGKWLIVMLRGYASLTWLLEFWHSLTALVLLACLNGTCVGLVFVLKRMLGIKDTTFSWCVNIMHECGLKPLLFNWCRVAMRLYNSLTESNSYTMNKVLHADMQLSTRSNGCWSAHILSAMDGLIQPYIYKQKLQNCEPFNLSHFVVDLRERHFEYWTPYFDMHPRGRTQQQTL